MNKYDTSKKIRAGERRIKVSRMNNLNSSSKSWKWDPAHWHGEEQSILGGQLHHQIFFRLFSFLWAVLRRPDLCSPSSFIDFYTFVHWKRFFSRARLSTSECLFTQTHNRRLRLPKHTQPSLAPLLPRPLRRFDSATISAKSKSKCRLNKTYSRAGERKKIIVEIFINYSGSDEAKGKLMN